MDKYLQILATLLCYARVAVEDLHVISHAAGCAWFAGESWELTGRPCDCVAHVHAFNQEQAARFGAEILAQVETVAHEGLTWRILRARRRPGGGYPLPQHNLACQCWPNLMRAFGCMTGHLTECHYPATCRQAQCSHLAKYDDQDAPPPPVALTPEEAAAVDRLWAELLNPDNWTETTTVIDTRPVEDAAADAPAS